VNAPSANSNGQRRVRQPSRARQLDEALSQAAEGDEGVRALALATALLTDAVRERASDIHLDPTEEGYDIRLRIDGALIDTIRLSKEHGLPLLRALKTNADLDPGFTLRPQDGRATLHVAGEDISVRVATGPGVRGEKLALRLLPHHFSRPLLDQIGLSTPDHAALIRALNDVRGMILISGPTGAGKTTTLYALVHELTALGRSVVSVEDPVEYELENVTQLQVNERQGLTYAEGVKGLLRLDPDILMMGEMRDAISARAALHAADSGHVVLSSLHARDAAGTISVLRHLGLTDHEIAASLDLLVAQRLVRRLCFACRRPEAPTPDEVRWLQMCRQPVPDKTWHAVGCPKCGGSGYSGRIGVFEIHRLTEKDAELILAHTDEYTLRKHLRGRGSLSMVQDDLSKVAEGLTTIAEFQSVGGMGFYADGISSAAWEAREKIQGEAR
jgi:type II secretory ATPase GspE/PulE/Tfp pilus assembly ATPase PilB-like protein